MTRDPLGIKPLYCGERDGAFYFASEIEALMEAPNTIYEFPTGYWLHSRTGWHSYFDIDSVQDDVNREWDPSEAIRQVLQQAVRKRLLADVSLGISLSGGLGSSIVALLASQEPAHLPSFAAGMEGSEDLIAARKVAELLKTHHYERIYSQQEILVALPKIIYHLESFDPALVRSAIPNFFLAEMASQYVQVILTGEGADEIYAGYDDFHSLESPRAIQEERLDSTAALHNTNLQRADRMAMAFGLEARVPFLDSKSITLGLGLPAEYKLHDDQPASHLLSQAFCDDLPSEIVNRPRQKFSKGAGSSDIIVDVAEREISDADFQAEWDRLMNRWGYRLPSKEALYYYRMLRQYFDDRWIFPTMGQSRCR